MAAFNKSNVVSLNKWLAKYNLASDVLKVFLTNTAILATDLTYTAISGNEIAAGNGYATGGNALTLVSNAQSGGLYKGIFTGYTLTATGAIPTFRYMGIYDSTGAAKDMIGWYDIGVAVTMANADTLQLVLDAVNGMIQDS
jgi:hypothetical protein